MTPRPWYGGTLPLFPEIRAKELTRVPPRVVVTTLEDELRKLRDYMRKRDADALHGWRGHGPHGRAPNGDWICLGTGPNTLRKP